MNENKLVVIISGANNGIGFYMTEYLLEQGYRVAGLDIEINNLLELQKTRTENLKVFEADVTNDLEVKEAVKAVAKEWERIDILVNNACIALFSHFEDKKIEDIMEEFEVNYFGYVRMIKEVLPYMKMQGKGIIHNVSSGVGLTGFTGMCGYTSTKGAIEALTLTLSYELKKYGISVSTMHPPLTNTKSASPLGVPSEFMEDPKVVGRKLASNILKQNSVITYNFQARIYVVLSRLFPKLIGGFFSKMTEKERNRK